MTLFNYDQQITPEQQSALESVLALAKACDFEVAHTLQVTRLALRLFDELLPLHGLNSQERFWLLAGSLLHDIGWVEGWKSHHKTSLSIILKSPLLTLDNRERLIIGSIARYHRKALPDIKHDHFAALAVDERQVVSYLAGILRIADGLDRSHQSVVQDLHAAVTAREITVFCQCDQPAYEEEQAALKKGDLLENLFHKKLIIRWTIQ